MKAHRIFAVILRHLYNFKHSYDRLTDVFYWPTLDLAVWGITSKFLVEMSSDASQTLFMVISGILLFIVVWRGQYEVTVNLLSELWDRNLVNLFVSPLKFSEWVTALFTIGIVKALISISFASFVAFLLYQTNIFSLGFYLIPFVCMLIMSGWAIGVIVAAIILKFGSKVQTLAWTVAGAVVPFSAVYFPVAVLPKWAQYIAYSIPTSYIFQGSRDVIFNGYLNWNYVAISFILNVFYLSIGLYFLNRSFKAALKKGLQNLS
jgi:ABC-2 type transport system permease protein